MKKGATTLMAFVLAIGFAATANASPKKKKPKPTPEPDCNIAPFSFDYQKVNPAIAAAIGDQGLRDAPDIATFVAQSLYPVYPGTDTGLSWPPEALPHDYLEAHPEVMCLWDLIIEQITIYVEEHGWPDDSVPQVSLDGIESQGDYPAPGSFMQVRAGDMFLGQRSAQNSSTSRSIAYTTLLTAGFVAAKNAGASDSEATTFAQKVARGDGQASQNRMDYFTLIQCSPYNDALYGTYGYGNNAMASPSGRAIRLLAQNFNNRKRLTENKAPRRNVELGTSSSAGDGSGTRINSTGRSFEFLWLPAINLTTLWESNGTVVTTEGVNWDDGSSGIMPPPEFQQLGVEDVPESVNWGC